MIVRQDVIEYRGKVVFERLEMLKNFKRVPKLFYENEACFLFLSEGDFSFRTPDNLLSFAPGDGMLAKCGNYFIEADPRRSGAPGQTVTVVGAFFYPDIVKEFFENDLSAEALTTPITVSKVHIDALLKHFVEQLNYLLDHPSIVDRHMVVHKQKELLMLLSKSENAGSVAGFVRALFSPGEHSFRDVVEKHMYSDLTIRELAYLCHMSEATFKRKFAALYRESPAKYILLKKLSRAQRLLMARPGTIAEVAYACGFASPSSFNRSFKKHFGITPSAYILSRMEKHVS